jgi:LysM repeat protein
MTQVHRRVRSHQAFCRVLCAGALLAAFSVPAAAQSLRGSDRSLEIQIAQAQAHDFTFLRTAAQLRRFVDAGYLVRVLPSADLELHAVSYPYARPQVRLFLTRLASQYRRACGEPLVVTSLTRPLSDQPSNASDRSVHPTGMAADIRRSSSPACRSWLERTLLSLERSKLLEATRESRPSHYHVAVFPRPYERYVARLVAAEASAVAAVVYTVQPGDSLWQIAQDHDTSVEELKQENNLDSSRIFPGQVLTIPPGGQ